MILKENIFQILNLSQLVQPVFNRFFNPWLSLERDFRVMFYNPSIKGSYGCMLTRL
jgi:hypothetical protein